MVERWGELEVSVLNGNPRYRYGYVGMDDHSMEPLLRPGSLVLVDPALDEIRNGGWTNEYERPIYFVQLHGGYRCGWCRLEGSRLFLETHPLSHCAPSVYRYPNDAEVLGQVVGVAMRLSAR